MNSVPDYKAGGQPELKVLALNSGSSSLKFGLYRVGPSRTDMLFSGEAEGIGEANGKFHAKDSQNNSLLSEAMSIPGQRDAVVRVAKLFTDLKTLAPDAIGHRIVHGGPKLRQHCLIDGPVLQPQSEHPHGLEDQDFDELFTKDKPVIFAFHGYPSLIHKLTYRRHNHDNIHVRGFRDEGTTTTPFDMVVLNNLDRFQLALDAIRRIPRLSDQVEKATARYWTDMERHKLYISEHGDDMPEVRDWRWNL